MNHLPILTTKIKRTYFPELLSINTPSEYTDNQKELIELEKQEGLSIIRVDSRLKDASEDILTGGIAYQLASISPAKHKKRTLLQRILRYRPAKEDNLEHKKSPEEILREKKLSSQLEAFLKYALLKPNSKNPNQYP